MAKGDKSTDAKVTKDLATAMKAQKADNKMDAKKPGKVTKATKAVKKGR